MGEELRDPADEHAPTDEHAPADEHVPTDEHAPTDEHVPTLEHAPTDEHDPKATLRHYSLDRLKGTSMCPGSLHAVRGERAR